jgi:hypothetical protein
LKQRRLFMPMIRYRQQVSWSNYHLTHGAVPPGGSDPAMIINTVATIDASDLTQPSGLARFAASGEALFGHLQAIERAQSASAAAGTSGTTGKAWSFSKLIGAPDRQLDLTGLTGIVEIGADELAVDAAIGGDRIALVSGGTLLAEIADWAEARGRTLCTSGTHLKPTIAGGFATASHGSRLGYGGLQDMVLGMHLLTGSSEHVWIERKTGPVLSAAGLAKLTIDGVPVRVVRDDERFEDALVHLGAMGIVNGIALELADNQRFALMQRLLAITPDLLDEIGGGHFDQVAQRLGCATAPVFYELTINPHAPFSDPAGHILYFPTHKVPLLPAGNTGIERPADVISRIGALMLAFASQPLLQPPAPALAAGAIPPWVFPALLKGADSVFAFYLGLKTFEDPNLPFDPEAPERPAYQWSELHGGEITGGDPGALYNASFAIPLDRVGKAIPAICAAVAQLAGSFVFTLRFVARPAGTLAFTRFDHNAVIEIDGLSPLICRKTAQGVDPDQPQAEELLLALHEMAGTLPAGAAATRAALDQAGIPYSMHWGKLGELDRAKVFADFGHPLDPDSLIRQWRCTRDDLLTPFAKSVFWNQALVDYGLLDPV